ncbi:polysaccharide deacetylase family protein [Arthrobacter bambusae]|uniref:polysaccharide deacetylase family protein n=1 Tax=Arthrobacter bambusae TaxID=1338426 RepID=UPI001F514F85|nr:polysaccharide deacetylase family protein [Arthrobacter bambusae]MCI0144085.1 polysaccharide deacetylase family protein [Arthrobacter bambusae]
MNQMPPLPSLPARRNILTVLGASMAAGLCACTNVTPPAAKADAASATAFSEPPPPTSPMPLQAATPATVRFTPSPTPTKKARKHYVPDVGLPPVENGLAPVITRILTKHPIVFLTIDDGGTKTAEMVALMAEYDYPVSIFLARAFIQDNPGFFTQFAAQGSLIENHTISHNLNMVQLNYAQQLAEITTMQTYVKDQYGRLPTLFRPPGGAYSNLMRKAVADAGLKAIITWEAKANAGQMDYQVGNSLRPGDIVLMHFRPEFAADLSAFRQAQLAAGLEVVLLEDFLGVE